MTSFRVAPLKSAEALAAPGAPSRAEPHARRLLRLVRLVRLLRLLRLAAVPATLLLGHAASAQVCTVAVISPAFGNYNGTGPGVDASGSLTVSCLVVAVATDVSYSVRMGFSGQAVGTQRKLGPGAPGLNYNLYCDSNRTQVWGDGSASTCTRTGGQAGFIGNLVTNFSVYARLPGGQFVQPGAYTDTVTISVLY